MDFEEAVELGKNKDNDGGRPRFYIRAVDYKDADGNVTSKDQVFVEIFNISDPKTVIDRPKTDHDEKRYAPYWKAYVENEEAPIDGTPIKSFPLLTPADIANCARSRIRTVEEIADLADGALQGVFGSRGFSTKQAAQKFLDYRQGDTSELLKRIQELENKLGDNTDDVQQRASGDGVHERTDTGGKRKPGRKANAGAAKKKRKSTRKKVPVESAAEGS